jgi:MFS family permease
LLIVALFSLGNSSDALLLLRARDLGLSAERTLLLYALFNVVEAALGYFAGRLSDRVGRKPLLAAGWLVFAGVYFGFAMARGPAAVWPLFVAYGLYYTLTQGVQKALAADYADPRRRAEEMGLFHMVVGILAFPASLAAGLLYDRVAPSAPFYLGGATAILAALALLGLQGRPGRNPGSRRTTS